MSEEECVRQDFLKVGAVLRQRDVLELAHKDGIVGAEEDGCELDAAGRRWRGEELGEDVEGVGSVVATGKKW